MQASRKLLAINPNNLAAMENMAVAAKNLNLYQDALNTYSQLFNLTSHTRFMYEIADVYFTAKQLNEGQKIFDQIINNPRSKTDNISMLLGPGRVTQVPVLTATYNYLGFYLAQNGNNEQAKVYYEKALEITPDFIITKNNLGNLSKGAVKEDKKGKK